MPKNPNTAKRLPLGVTGSYCPGPAEVTRYTLQNGWFIDGCKVGPHRDPARKNYALFEPGAAPEGGALKRSTSNKLAELVRLALDTTNKPK